MILRNYFFTIREMVRNEQTAVVTVKIDGSHPVFAGHFPEKSVVPGVFSLQMIRECLEELVEQKLQYIELKNCKFSNAILPDDQQILQLVYDYAWEGDFLNLKAFIRQGDTVYLSLKGKLAIQGDPCL